MKAYQLFSLIVPLALIGQCAPGLAAEKKGGADGSQWSEVCEILYDARKPVVPAELTRVFTHANADSTCEYEGSGNHHPVRELHFAATPFFLASIRADAPAALQILRMGIDVNKLNSYHIHANYSVFDVEGEPNSYVALRNFSEYFSGDNAEVKLLFEELLQKRPKLNLVEHNYDIRTWRTDRQASVLGVLLSPWETTAGSLKVAAYVAASVSDKTQVLREAISGNPDKCYDFESSPQAQLVATRCN